MRSSRAVLLAAALLFAWNLWGYDLGAPDEPYFAEGAREMLADGHWAVPHVNGAVTTDKPPLFFWLIAICSLPFGQVTEVTARIPSALAALGTVALTLRLGRRLSSESTASLAGLVLATTWMFWDKARSAQIDSLLCFLILAALCAFQAFREGKADGRRAGWLFWSASALAVLAKGPVGLMLPLGIALVTLAADRNLRLWRRFAPVSGLCLFVAVIALWAAVATVGGRGEYSVVSAFDEHVAKRAVFGMHHAQPPWYYLKSLPLNLLPWTALVPGALFLAFRRRDAGDRFLLVFALFVAAFFSVFTEKRDLYVLPAFPAFALLVARLVGEVRGWESAAASPRMPADRRWVTIPQALTGILLTAAGIAAPIVASRLEMVPMWIAVMAGALLSVTGLVTAWRAIKGRDLGSVLLTAGGVGAVYLIIASLILPALDSVKSARHFALRIKTVTATSRQAGHEVLGFRLQNLVDAFAFYTDGVYLEPTMSAVALAAHLEQGDLVYAVADAGDLHRLPGGIWERIVTLDSAQLNHRTIVLIRNTPGPRLR